MNSKQEYNRRYRQQHRAELIEYQRQYRKEHKAELAISRKEYYKKHRERELAARRAYGQKHRTELIAKCRADRRRYKLQALTWYSIGDTPQCAHCGIIDIDLLCIDHVNGGGGRHRKEAGYSYIYSWLKTNNYPDGFQVLCYNCNMKKTLREDRNNEEE